MTTGRRRRRADRGLKAWARRGWTRSTSSQSRAATPSHRDAEAAVGGGADLPARVVGQATADVDELAEELVGDREVLQPGVEAVPVQDARDVVRRDPLGRGATDPGSNVLREDADVRRERARNARYARVLKRLGKTSTFVPAQVGGV
jgi:hypothetical protein